MVLVMNPTGSSPPVSPSGYTGRRADRQLMGTRVARPHNGRMGKDIRNPWTDLRTSAPYVLAVDRPYVDAWNHWELEASVRCLRTDLVPVPFDGARDAPVVVLQRNPAWREDTPGFPLQPKDLSLAIRETICDNPSGRVHTGFLDRFENSSAGRWWRPRWRKVQEASGLTYEELGHRVLGLQWYGYFSQKFAALPVTLPSQWYQFDLVRRAVERGAVIVITRGEADWRVAVPALRTYGRVFVTRSWQNASVSPGNLPDGFNEVVAAVMR